ncbi:uncharacterized protein Spn85F isoform X2 [Eurosta solidaginis]|uniref:uncharacterized protein Spn85F isoform X2 n=1 Tax=Eurosta solidaginis TaxID=178769 RepID=UPI003530CDAE
MFFYTPQKDSFKAAAQQHFNSILWSFVIFTLLLKEPLPLANAHYIQFNHNAFRSNNNFVIPTLSKPPLDQHLGSRELSPAEYMVDLSNAVTYRILHYHSVLNRNNFAFSPTALMSVLIALYEGSAGRSALELRNVLQLPNSRDVIRVGYRDIHRKLRTYFFGSENPLKGLSLNKDNVTITRGYEAVLVFYGYDLGMDMVSSTTSSPSSTTPTANITDGMEILKTTKSPTTEYTTSLPNTKNNTEYVPTDSSDSISIMPDTTLSSTTLSIDTDGSTKTVKVNETTTITGLISSTQMSTTEESTGMPGMPSTTTEGDIINISDVTTSAETDAALDPTKENDAAELVAESPIESKTAPFQRLQKIRPIQQPSAKLQAPPTSVSTPKHNYLPQYIRSRNNRPKRHLIGLKEGDANLFVNFFNPHHQKHRGLYTITHPITGTTSLGQFTSDYEVETLDARLLNVAHDKSNYGYNTDVISHVFYLATQELIHTTFKVYNAVLYFKYFEDLKISVLELELDTPNYNLMILLPDYQIDLISSTASLELAPPLRLMRKQLKPRWVQAIIPDFKLHGTTFLTNDLQNLLAYTDNFSLFKEILD